jgi:uncharacterized low-complexity protein
MAEKKVIKPVALAVGAALAGSFAISGAVNAADTAESPFSISNLEVGYMLGEGEGKCGSDKEGEGACGMPKVNAAKVAAADPSKLFSTEARKSPRLSRAFFCYINSHEQGDKSMSMGRGRERRVHPLSR